VYDHFDHNKDGQISYAEFVDGLKSNMSENRLKIVQHAWAKLSGGANCVSFESLVSKYNAPAHPRVLAREKQAETVFSDFVAVLGEKAVGGNISMDAFLCYYSEINAVMPNEKENYFIDMLIKTWGIDSDKASVSASCLAQMEDVIFEKVR